MFTLGGGIRGKRNSRERFDQIPVVVHDSKGRVMTNTSAGMLKEDYVFNCEIRGKCHVYHPDTDHSMNTLYNHMLERYETFSGLRLVVSEGGSKC